LTAPTVGQPQVEVADLTRTFGSRRALDRVSFQLRAGGCLAIFGPNGAGKTTLLRLLAGLLRPSSGVARIGGTALPGGAEVRAKVGLISHQSMLYGVLTARENVRFAARIFGVRDASAAADRALSRLGLADRADTPVRLLSRGMQQRVSIARAMVHDPRVLLADEPYSGLDAPGAAALTTLLGELRANGAAMVVVTHNVAEGLALGTHAGVLLDGGFARFDAVSSLDAAGYGLQYLRLVARDVA
jgi:heme exporter protein A